MLLKFDFRYQYHCEIEIGLKIFRNYILKYYRHNFRLSVEKNVLIKAPSRFTLMLLTDMLSSLSEFYCVSFKK
jgi:hypothetical protein